MIRRCVLRIFSQTDLEGAALSAPNFWDTTERVPPIWSAAAPEMTGPGRAICLRASLSAAHSQHAHGFAKFRYAKEK